EGRGARGGGLQAEAQPRPARTRVAVALWSLPLPLDSSRRDRSRRDHHAAGRVLEDVLDRAAEDRLTPQCAHLPRRAEDDDLAPRLLRLLDDRLASRAAAQSPRLHADAVELSDRARLGEDGLQLLLLVGHVRVER